MVSSMICLTDSVCRSMCPSCLYSSRSRVASCQDGVHEQHVALCDVFGQLFIDELLLHQLVTHPACHSSCTTQPGTLLVFGEVGAESTEALALLTLLPFVVPH